MERRSLGQLDLSAIGLGCATMTPFYGEPDPVEAVATIRRAAELGVDLLDTSDAYGHGRNEELINRAIEGRRNEYVTRCGRGTSRAASSTPAASSGSALSPIARSGAAF